MNNLRQFAATLALIGACLPLAAAAQVGHAAHGSHGHHGGHAHHGAQHTPLPAAPIEAGDSIYHLDSVWTDHRGQSLRLADFRGAPVLVTMIYGSCQSACPILVHDLMRVQQALSEAERAQTKIIAVSFDSLRDTPQVLAEYAQARGSDQPQWHYLNGDAAQVRTLAALLGVRYRDNKDGTFDHSNLIAVLDGDGRIVHRTEGLMQPVEPAVKALRAAR